MPNPFIPYLMPNPSIYILRSSDTHTGHPGY